MMFQLIIITDDILSARYKLANYYLREFTEISLYSSQETNKKVPLPKLYVAIKWMDYNEYAFGGMEYPDKYAFNRMEYPDKYAFNRMEYPDKYAFNRMEYPDKYAFNRMEYPDKYASSGKKDSDKTQLTDYTEIFKTVSI